MTREYRARSRPRRRASSRSLTGRAIAELEAFKARLRKDSSALRTYLDELLAGRCRPTSPACPYALWETYGYEAASDALRMAWGLVAVLLPKADAAPFCATVEALAIANRGGLKAAYRALRDLEPPLPWAVLEVGSLRAI